MNQSWNNTKYQVSLLTNKIKNKQKVKSIAPADFKKRKWTYPKEV